MRNEQFGKIAMRFGGNFAKYADENLAGWVIDMLLDERSNKRGPQKGTVVSEHFFAAHPEWHSLRSDVPWAT